MRTLLPAWLAVSLTCLAFLPPRQEQLHWAYVQPVRSALPEVGDEAWVRNPIDRFVLARLEAQGLRPSPEAGREALARRDYPLAQSLFASA